MHTNVIITSNRLIIYLSFYNNKQNNITNKQIMNEKCVEITSEHIRL